MAQVGPVVLIGLQEWQIDKVVEHESEADCHDGQALVVLLIAEANIKAKREPVSNGERNVGSG